MKSVKVPVAIDVFRKLRIGAIAVLLMVVVASGCIVVAGAVQEFWPAMLALVPFIGSIVTVRRETRSRVPREVEAEFFHADGVLRMMFPKTRFFDDRYVDQCYSCACDSIERVAIGAGKEFRIQARDLEGFATERDEVLEHRFYAFTEVKFNCVEASEEVLASFLEGCGLPVSRDYAA